jgi:Xaa-Pro aminopeptidase
MEKELILEKSAQAARILDELDIDLWLIFVRESSVINDPSIGMVVGANATWQSAFLIHRNGDTAAIVGSLELPLFQLTGTFKTVTGYLKSVNEPLLEYLNKYDPKKIAINYSVNSSLADGLTYGMYLTLTKILSGTPYAARLISSEDIVAALRGRKSKKEIGYIKAAIAETLDIYNMVSGFVQPGRTEQEVAGFILDDVKRRGLETAWGIDHCPSVFSGPDTAGAHSGPTDRVIEKGHIINVDFGVKVNGYCSDLQRTWYVLRDGEDKAPADVQKGYDVIQESITRSAAAIKPGMMGCEIDDIARSYIVGQGYDEYKHGLGHQVGRICHDGGCGLFPRWERYGNLPFLKLEAGQVFTIEPRLTVEGKGIATIEEMIQVTDTGNEWLSTRQDKLWLIR